MPACYIDRRDITLEYQSGVMILRAPDAPPRSLPLRQIDSLVVRSQVRIDTRLLTHLADQGSALLFMDGRAGRRTAFVQGYRHGDAERRIRQYQAHLDEGVRLLAAQWIVHRRMRSQYQMLGNALRQRADQRRPLFAARRQIRSFILRVRDADNLDSLRGLEGAAAAAYYRGFAAILPERCKFSGRNRRPPRDPVNAALSLGYTLLHSEATRALQIAGLDPLLGLYHDLAHNREALACDLMERHRCAVDHMVWRLFAERQIDPQQFETHNGACLMNKSARGSFYRAFESNAAARRPELAADAQLLLNTLQEWQPGAEESVAPSSLSGGS